MDDLERITRLADAAAATVEHGMVLGLGSGSTAEAFIAALGRRVATGLQVSGVATSKRTERAATAAGVALTTLEITPRLERGFDGADEIDPNLNLTKGRGGALLPEKMVALACERWTVLAASEKLVECLGTRIRLPVEVVPFGWEQTGDRLKALGLKPALRRSGDGPFETDSRHFIFDCETGAIDDPVLLATQIKAITGVVEHGLFLGLANEAMIAEPDGQVTTRS